MHWSLSHEQNKMSSSVYELCRATLPDGTESQLLECIAMQFEQSQEAIWQDLRNFLFVTAGALIFFMQSGFAMVCAGAVRSKNVQNSMLKNLLDACGAAVAFYLIGKLWMLSH